MARASAIVAKGIDAKSDFLFMATSYAVKVIWFPSLYFITEDKTVISYWTIRLVNSLIWGVFVYFVLIKLFRQRPQQGAAADQPYDG